MIPKRSISQSPEGGEIKAWTDIIKAAHRCDLDAMKTAIDEDPSCVNATDADTSLSVLHIVSAHGFASGVRFLLEQPDLNASKRDNEHRTAVDLASQIGREDIAGMIFDYQYGAMLDEVCSDDFDEYPTSDDGQTGSVVSIDAFRLGNKPPKPRGP